MGEHRGFGGSETTLCDTIMVDTCHLSKPIECNNTKRGPSANCGLWVIMVCPCGFIYYGKCGVLIVGASVCVRGVYGHSLPSAQFCCQLKTLKNKV